jgi:general secretion pathway protein A
VLTLHLPGQDDRWALLTAITTDSATLRAGSETWRLPLSVLADIWRGDYTTLWQLPPDHQGELRRGDSGAAGIWLRQQLDQLASSQPTIASATNLTSRIEAFQRSQGLETDGLAGPMTFMQLNRVSGVNEPRLRSPST